MSKLSVNVAIAYPVTYRARRARTDKTIWLPETIEVDINVPEPGDYEKVIDVGVSLGAGPIFRQQRTIFGGALYGDPDATKWYYTAGIEAEDFGEIRRALATRSAVRRLISKNIESFKDWDAINDDDVLPDNVDVVVDNGRERAIEEISAIIAQFIVVDRHLLAPKGCPVIEVAHTISLDEKSSWTHLSENAEPDHGFIFALNDSAKANKFMTDFGYKPHRVITEVVSTVYNEASLPPLFLQEKNAAQAVGVLFETIAAYIKQTDPDGFLVLSRLAELRRAAMAFDVSAPAMILNEIKKFENSGFHCTVGDLEIGLLKRAAAIGCAAIEMSPPSPDLSSDLDATLEGLRV